MFQKRLIKNNSFKNLYSFLFSNNLFNPEMRPNYSFMLNYVVWVFDQEESAESLKRLIDVIHGPMTTCPFHFALNNLQNILQRVLQIRITNISDLLKEMKKLVVLIHASKENFC